MQDNLNVGLVHKHSSPSEILETGLHLWLCCSLSVTCIYVLRF